jgi:hypothetical protein
MSDLHPAGTPRAIDCAEFDAGVAELALELLDARSRDELLLHAATCARCAEELQQMSAVADRLTLLADEVEPPLGFDQRVMASIAAQPRTIAQQRKRRRVSRLWAVAAAALVLFLGGIALGLAAHRSDGRIADSVAHLRYAELLDSAGGHHGSVSLVEGVETVLTMSIAHLDAGEDYHCVVHRADGSSEDIASWPANDQGGGRWAVAIEDPIDSVGAVSVADGRGVIVATARFP